MLKLSRNPTFTLTLSPTLTLTLAPTACHLQSATAESEAELQTATSEFTPESKEELQAAIGKCHLNPWFWISIMVSVKYVTCKSYSYYIYLLLGYLLFLWYIIKYLLNYVVFYLG